MLLIVVWCPFDSIAVQLPRVNRTLSCVIPFTALMKRYPTWTWAMAWVMPSLPRTNHYHLERTVNITLNSKPNGHWNTHLSETCLERTNASKCHRTGKPSLPSCWIMTTKLYRSWKFDKWHHVHYVNLIFKSWGLGHVGVWSHVFLCNRFVGSGSFAFVFHWRVRNRFELAIGIAHGVLLSTH